MQGGCCSSDSKGLGFGEGARWLMSVCSGKGQCEHRRSSAGVSAGVLFFSVSDDEELSGSREGWGPVNSLHFGRAVVFLPLSSQCQINSLSLSEAIVMCTPWFFVGRAGEGACGTGVRAWMCRCAVSSQV